MSDLLIVKAKPGIDVNPDLMRYWCYEILKQKETGVVVLPWFLNVVVVPEDVEVQFIDPKSSCVLEEGLEVEVPLDDKTCENCKFEEVEFLSGPCPMCDASHSKFERRDRNVKHQTRAE